MCKGDTYESKAAEFLLRVLELAKKDNKLFTDLLLFSSALLEGKAAPHIPRLGAAYQAEAINRSRRTF